MCLLPRFVALVLACTVLAVPAATAFSAPGESVLFEYDWTTRPTVMAVGALAADGEVQGAVVGMGLQDARFEAVPRVTVVERTPDGGARNTTLEDVTLIVHSGDLLWQFGEDGEGVVRAAISTAYGVVLALPAGGAGAEHAPGPAGGDGGLLFAAPEFTGAFVWSGGHTGLVPADAVVTLVHADGSPVEGWSAREVNPGTAPGAGSDARTLDVTFVTEGAFDAAWASEGVIAGPGGSGLTVSLKPSDEPRYEDALAVLDRAGAALAEAGPDVPAENPLAALESVSDVLNGAVIVFAPPGEDGVPAVPREARVGNVTLETGAVTLMRARDVRLQWSEDVLRVEGPTALTFAGQGFAAKAPLALGPVPVVSLVLWFLAAGAVAFFFARPPGKDPAPAKWRVTAWSVHALVLVIAFVLWDVSFRATFGTSILQMVRAGFGADASPAVAVAALQLASWSLAAVLFALPVRIAVGVGLRQRGLGKGLGGFANAAGLLVLVLLGPVYALWLLNALLALVADRLPPFGP